MLSNQAIRLDPDYTWLLGLIASHAEPRRPLTVSEWADAHRVLSGKSAAEPGPWRTARVPYAKEIMDALSEESPVQRVVIMKPAQSAGTEVGLNWLGYVMDHVRTGKPMAVITPSDELRDRMMVGRIRPMLDGAESLKRLVDVAKSRDGSSRLDMIDYPGGILYLRGSGSATRLKSDPIRFVFCDEVDEFEVDTGARGDPMKLIESRTSSFARRKILVVSTPTIKGASRIEAEFEKSDQRQYQVPCPHCGEYQALEWIQMKWTYNVDQVWYTCEHNGCVIEERDKPEMLAAGRWVPQMPKAKGVRGYHWNALYSPLGLGYGWKELVRQWIEAQGDQLKLKPFKNERLAQVWTLSGDTKPSEVAERAEEYHLGEIPPGPLLLTAGVDTQDNELVMQVIGWRGGGRGKPLRWWAIDWARIPGDPEREEVWGVLAERLNQTYRNAYGRDLRIKATAIDQSGHHTDAVKAFALSGKVRHFITPVLGDNNRQKKLLSPPIYADFTWRGKVIKNGSVHHRVGTEAAKDKLFSQIESDRNHPTEDRLCHFSMDLPMEYYKGLLSEVWDPTKHLYKPIIGRGNEPLDTWVYAFAVGYHQYVDLDGKTRRAWDSLAQMLEPAEQDEDGKPDKPTPSPVRAPKGGRQRPRGHGLGTPDWVIG